MSTPPRITLVTASFNRADMIADMMASVARQAFPPVQHLVLDGCSTDGTASVMAAYPQAEFLVARDKGVYDAWNKALEKVAGDWVIYLNTDDLLPGNAFQSYAAALLAVPDAAIVTGVAGMEDANGAGLRETREERAASNLSLENLRLQGCILNARLIRTSLLRQAGSLDLALHPASDLDLLIRIARIRPRAAYTRDQTYIYRRHAGSITLGDKAAGNYRTPGIGLALIDRELGRGRLDGAEQANLYRWRRVYMDALLASNRLKSDPRGWGASLARCARYQPGATLQCLAQKIFNRGTRAVRSGVPANE